MSAQASLQPWPLSRAVLKLQGHLLTARLLAAFVPHAQDPGRLGPLASHSTSHWWVVVDLPPQPGLTTTTHPRMIEMASSCTLQSPCQPVLHLPIECSYGKKKIPLTQQFCFGIYPTAALAEVL